MQTDVRQTESILFCQEAFWRGDAPPRMPHDPNTLCASITLLGRPVSVRAPVRAAMGGVSLDLRPCSAKISMSECEDALQCQQKVEHASSGEQLPSVQPCVTISRTPAAIATHRVFSRMLMKGLPVSVWYMALHCSVTMSAQ